MVKEVDGTMLRNVEWGAPNRERAKRGREILTRASMMKVAMGFEVMPGIEAIVAWAVECDVGLIIES
jgi:hypothetical protein